MPSDAFTRSPSSATSIGSSSQRAAAFGVTAANNNAEEPPKFGTAAEPTGPSAPRTSGFGVRATSAAASPMTKFDTATNSAQQQSPPAPAFGPTAAANNIIQSQPAIAATATRRELINVPAAENYEPERSATAMPQFGTAAQNGTAPPPNRFSTGQNAQATNRVAFDAQSANAGTDNHLSDNESEKSFATAATSRNEARNPSRHVGFQSDNNGTNGSMPAQNGQTTGRFPSMPSGLDGARSVSTSQVSLFSSVPNARHEDLFSNGQRQNAVTGISVMDNSALDRMDTIREALRGINDGASRSTSRLSMGNTGPPGGRPGANSGHGHFSRPQHIPSSYQRNSREDRNGYHGQSRAGYVNNRNRFAPRSRSRPRQTNGSQEGGRPGARPKYVPQPMTEFDIFDERQLIEPGERFASVVGDLCEEDIHVTGGDGDHNLRAENFGDGENSCSFHEQLVKNAAKVKVYKPTAIQKAAMPLIMTKTADIMAHAPTGSGKTDAFLLPIIFDIQNMKDAEALDGDGNRVRQPALNKGTPYAIVVAVTRDLVIQIKTRAIALTHGLDVKVAYSFGELDMGMSRDVIQKGCDIFITTMGRLTDFVFDRAYVKLNKVKYLVLDEADQMLRSGNRDQEKHLLDIKRSVPATCRTFMFSATFDDDVQDLAVREFLKEGYFFITIGELNHTVATVEQEVLMIDGQGRTVAKTEKLKELLNEWTLSTEESREGKRFYRVHKTLVFVKHKRDSDRLAVVLHTAGFKSISINADRTMEQRQDACAKFKSGEYDVMVASDLMARGINYPKVAHVVLYDLYGTEEQYVHRIGRTGRVGNLGHSVAFFDPGEPQDQLWAPRLIKFLNQRQALIPRFLKDAADRRNTLGYRTGAAVGAEDDGWNGPQ